MTGRGVGDVAHLGLGDIQQPGKLGPIRGRLVQQDQELAVGKHKPGGIGAQAPVSYTHLTLPTNSRV